jgi:hypothetical protein
MVDNSGTYGEAKIKSENPFIQERAMSSGSVFRIILILTLTLDVCPEER